MVVQNTNIGYTVFGILNEPFFNSISLLNKKVYVTRNKISKNTLQIFGLKTEKEGPVRLSMPMVVQWLKAYNPVATIRSPMATIMGIRHLNNDRDPEPDYIYVGKISDLFPGSVSSEVSEARAEMPFAEVFETVWEEPLELNIKMRTRIFS